MESEFVNQLTVLGHSQRLAVFRMLMRRYPDAVPAGEIAEAMALKPSTLSVYLSALRQAGLILQHRQGTSLRYTADVESASALVTFLFADCCRGRPDLCDPIHSPQAIREPAMTQKKYNVLFICTGNSARSIFGECLLRDIAGDRFNVFSAGTNAKSELNPFALEVLKANGHDITPLRAKSLTEFQQPNAPIMDFVFTVCDQAANEDCPAWPGQPITAHWGLPDPVKATGTEAEKRLAFRLTYAALRNRITPFAALDLTALGRVALQAHLDEISKTKDTA
ncbi:transcriptional regulator, ArsR family [Thalassovita taeanensis]|uniref:Transcriptional regulator, ArsR family n=2 Tax=Thalassovita taeanensis TaxID=657014 RepID=A0A1H9I4Y3_9RHOB|nr:helix-turn-helix domain-containing protein [Thalassovita taeanensis]SEQ69639.1 transcriptional regulator, ArsR family [Thalassovita taeanensis]